MSVKDALKRRKIKKCDKWRERTKIVVTHASIGEAIVELAIRNGLFFPPLG